MNRTLLYRYLHVVLLSVISVVTATSQIRIGVHGGVSVSDVTEPRKSYSDVSWEVRTYAHGGLIADYSIAQHWQVAMEINYIRKGIRIPNDDWGLPIRGTTTLTADYFEIPLKIRFRAGVRPFWLYVEGGGSLAFLQSGQVFTVKLPYGGMPYKEEIYEVSGVHRSRQPSVLAGLGAEYELTSSLSLKLSASYVYGLSDVYNNFWEESKGRGVQLDAGVLLTL